MYVGIRMGIGVAMGTNEGYRHWVQPNVKDRAWPQVLEYIHRLFGMAFKECGQHLCIC